MRAIICALLVLVSGSVEAAARQGARQVPPSGQNTGRLDVVDPLRRDPFQSGARRWQLFVYPEASRQRAYATDSILLRDMVGNHYYDQDSTVLAGWKKASAAAGSLTTTRRSPLILLLPGQGVAAFNYRYLAESLVNQGFVVAVLDLPYLGYARGSDGRFRRASDDPLAKSEDAAAWKPRFADWARDVSLSLDALQRSRLAKDIDFTRITAAGHSLGGTVAVDSCSSDRRIVACADFEGAPFGTRIESEGPVKPTLFVLSRSLKPDRPLVKPDASSPMFAFLRGEAPVDAWAVSVGGGSHMSFSDAPLVMPDTITRFGGEVMNPARSMTVYSTILGAFAKAYAPGGGGARAFDRKLAALPEVRATLVPTGQPAGRIEP